jgi:hypothetical protein
MISALEWLAGWGVLLVVAAITLFFIVYTFYALAAGTVSIVLEIVADARAFWRWFW